MQMSQLSGEARRVLGELGKASQLLECMKGLLALRYSSEGGGGQSLKGGQGLCVPRGRGQAAPRGLGGGSAWIRPASLGDLPPLRSDAEFQRDLVDPSVKEAMEVIKQTNDTSRQAGAGQD